MKIAQIIYTPFEGPGNKSKVYRALRAAQELRERGHLVRLVFDGAGTEALAAMSRPEHPFHKLLEGLRSNVDGACASCAKSYAVAEALLAAGFRLLRDYRGEASVAAYLEQGYQVVTY